MVGSASRTPARVEIHFYGLRSDQASHQRTINRGSGQCQLPRTLRKQVLLLFITTRHHHYYYMYICVRAILTTRRFQLLLRTLIRAATFNYNNNNNNNNNARQIRKKDKNSFLVALPKYNPYPFQRVTFITGYRVRLRVRSM